MHSNVCVSHVYRTHPTLFIAVKGRCADDTEIGRQLSLPVPVQMEMQIDIKIGSLERIFRGFCKCGEHFFSNYFLPYTVFCQIRSAYLYEKTITAARYGEWALK